MKLIAALVGVACLAGSVGAGIAKEPPLQLAYASEVAGNLDVFVATVAPGAGPRRLTASRRDEFSPAWSPDGRYIAYRMNQVRSDVGDIWVMRANGSGKRNLTRSPQVADWSPAWSPDGTRIAYFSMAGGGGDVWVMRADGSRRRNLTRDAGLNEYPAWSPDGRRLAFNSHRDGQFEIYRANVHGSGQVDLTRHPARDQWPAWSPDGTLIAFMSERDGSEDVFVMRPDGSGVRDLTRTDALDESHPAWMPDGRLSFSRHGDTGPVDLLALDVANGRSERVATDVQPVFAFAWRPRAGSG